MPKKFAGENGKAVAAKARKAEAKTKQEVIKQKQKEDELWKEDDKLILKKQQRQEELDKKKQEQSERKAEAKMLLEKEMDSLKTQGKQPLSKITRAQIVAETEKRNQAAKQGQPAQNAPKAYSHMPLEENLNKLNPIGAVATSIDEAIAVLSVKEEETDKHPEKRLKAAYADYEEKKLPILKAENPSLKLSQLKQMIFKEWQKAPENPLNQRLKTT